MIHAEDGMTVFEFGGGDMTFVRAADGHIEVACDADEFDLDPDERRELGRLLLAIED